MTRIISGQAGGRRLETPPGDNTRPTSDRVREAIFSALESWAGTLAGLRVLDLYAGSGALGLEAWSRGAAAVTLVEHDRPTAAVIRSNATLLKAPVEVVVGSVPTVLARGAGVGYDVVFCDPPYVLSDEAIATDLALLVAHGWLAADALLVVERGKRSNPPQWPAGVEAGRTKKYGETVVYYAHVVDRADSQTASRTDSQDSPQAAPQHEETP